MGKDQAGKSHNYPSCRKPYSSGRKGIGGWKKKNDSAATSNKPTYFDMQLHKQREKGRLKWVLHINTKIIVLTFIDYQL